ncbi:MAG: hypothetical protein Q8L34_02675 [Candidatus Woesearchaeota archaeon]|nr:hypothetical protein [Candidatus Woesearchaeota archaeon]
MNKNMKERRIEKIGNGLKEAFNKPQYMFLSLSIAVLFFAINIVLPNSKTLLEIFATQGIGAGWRFLLVLLEGSFGSMTVTSSILLITIAVLLGIVVSLIVYKVKTIKGSSMQNGKITTVGAILGIAAPGCASCGIGVLSIFGLTSSLAVLPFKGAEIGFISVALLATSTASLATRITEGESCKIEFKKKKK